jgi:hypothetical protein
MDSKKLPKVAQKMYCNFCDYNTSKLSSFQTTWQPININDSKMIVK